MIPSSSPRIAVLVGREPAGDGADPAPDGAIEALEGPGLLAVQWHPERLYRCDPAAPAPLRWLAGA